MSWFRNRNDLLDDRGTVWIPGLRAKSDIHDEEIKKLHIEIENLKGTVERLEKLTDALCVVFTGTPQDTAPLRKESWDLATKMVCGRSDQAYTSVRQDSRKQAATMRYLELQSELQVLREDYAHLGDLK